MKAASGLYHSCWFRGKAGERPGHSAPSRRALAWRRQLSPGCRLSSGALFATFCCLAEVRPGKLARLRIRRCVRVRVRPYAGFGVVVLPVCPRSHTRLGRKSSSFDAANHAERTLCATSVCQTRLVRFPGTDYSYLCCAVPRDSLSALCQPAMVTTMPNTVISFGFNLF